MFTLTYTPDAYKQADNLQPVTLMSEEQMTAEVGVPKENQPGFRSALNQLKTALEKPRLTGFFRILIRANHESFNLFNTGYQPGG